MKFAFPKGQGYPFMIAATAMSGWCFLLSLSRFGSDTTFRFWSEFHKLAANDKWIEASYIQFQKDDPKNGSILKRSKDAFNMELPSFFVGFLTGAIMGPNLPGFSHWSTSFRGGKIAARVLVGSLGSVMLQWGGPSLFLPALPARIESQEAYVNYLANQKGLPSPILRSTNPPSFSEGTTTTSTNNSVSVNQ